MTNEQDFTWLLNQDKESLIALVMRLLSRVEELEKPVSLPEFPVGQYVIKDGADVVRMVEDETEVLQDQVEGMAILFSLGGYARIYFYLDNTSQLLSEWSNGKRICRC